jgi:hypothetical protein
MSEVRTDLEPDLGLSPVKYFQGVEREG